MVYCELELVLKNTIVKITKNAEKDLRKIPRYVVVKLLVWQRAVELNGLEHTQKIKGYHDEP